MKTIWLNIRFDLDKKHLADQYYFYLKGGGKQITSRRELLRIIRTQLAACFDNASLGHYSDRNLGLIAITTVTNLFPELGE